MFVGIQKRDRQDSRTLNNDTFYTPPVKSAQCLIGTERYTDAGICICIYTYVYMYMYMYMYISDVFAINSSHFISIPFWIAMLTIFSKNE